MTGQDFVQRPEVKKNFWGDFNRILDPSYGIKSLDDLDFSRIYEFLLKRKEEKKERPKEERKQELEERKENESQYRYCLIDGLREQIEPIAIEPPSIFKGRGEHPSVGLLKR
jgi:DNA topoisomerase I